MQFLKERENSKRVGFPAGTKFSDEVLRWEQLQEQAKQPRKVKPAPVPRSTVVSEVKPENMFPRGPFLNLKSNLMILIKFINILQGVQKDLDGSQLVSTNPDLLQYQTDIAARIRELAPQFLEALKATNQQQLQAFSKMLAGTNQDITVDRITLIFESNLNELAASQQAFETAFTNFQAQQKQIIVEPPKLEQKLEAVEPEDVPPFSEIDKAIIQYTIDSLGIFQRQPTETGKVAEKKFLNKLTNDLLQSRQRTSPALEISSQFYGALEQLREEQDIYLLLLWRQKIHKMNVLLPRYSDLRELVSIEATLNHLAMCELLVNPGKLYDSNPTFFTELRGLKEQMHRDIAKKRNPQIEPTRPKIEITEASPSASSSSSTVPSDQAPSAALPPVLVPQHVENTPTVGHVPEAVAVTEQPPIPKPDTSILETDVPEEPIPAKQDNPLKTSVTSMSADKPNIAPEIVTPVASRRSESESENNQNPEKEAGRGIDYGDCKTNEPTPEPDTKQPPIRKGSLSRFFIDLMAHPAFKGMAIALIILGVAGIIAGGLALGGIPSLAALGIVTLGAKITFTGGATVATGLGFGSFFANRDAEKFVMEKSKDFSAEI